MNIQCNRCGKVLNSPDKRNADYVLIGEETAILCPMCYNPKTDVVIWGVHKETR